MALRNLVLAATVLFATSAFAEEDVTGRLSVELNSLETVENACRMSFLVLNGQSTDVSKAVFEAVLFANDGRVDRLTLFDFGALTSGRPRVRQFVVPALSCDGLGQVLINGVETCASVGGSKGLCTDGLLLNSRVSAELIG